MRSAGRLSRPGDFPKLRSFKALSISLGRGGGSGGISRGGGGDGGGSGRVSPSGKQNKSSPYEGLSSVYQVILLAKKFKLACMTVAYFVYITDSHRSLQNISLVLIALLTYHIKLILHV